MEKPNTWTTKLSPKTIDAILDEVRDHLEHLDFSERLGDKEVAKKVRHKLVDALYKNERYIRE